MTALDPAKLVDLLGKFGGRELTATLSGIERSVQGVTADDCSKLLLEAGAAKEVLAAAAAMKRLASQIHVVIHALGILLCLPHILQEGEEIEYVSLGAGNTGREFDLETNYRVAEFKFIHWRGGAESIRQNAIFQDFFLLAESESGKRKYLYVLGTEQPLKFLNGGRNIKSVLGKNDRVRDRFYARYGDRYKTIRDYYLPRRGKVVIEDVSPWLPELVSDVVPEGTNGDVL